jgi:D-alanyl-D-alanine carboxypeptidase
MMKSKILKTLAVLAVVLVAPVIGGWAYLAYHTAKNDNACLPNEQAPVESDLETAASLQAVLDQYSQAHDHAGLQAAIIFPDGDHWHGVSGYANHAKACPLTLVHNLELASITKTFTAALVMEQVEAGRLRLDDPIETWIAHPDGDRITVEMLLRHTSGLPNYTDLASMNLGMFSRVKNPWQPNELLDAVIDQPLKFEPGSRYEYSNTNYVSLGIILEKASGKPYGELLQDAAAKMGLERLYFLAGSQEIPFANGYDETMFNLGKLNMTAFRTVLESYAFTAGGIAGSAQDNAAFFHALFTGEWLAADTVAQLIDTIDAPDEDIPLQTGYGLGVRSLAIDGESVYGHTGSVPGYSGIAMHNLERGFTIVVLSNVSTIEQTNLFAELQAILMQSG